jgi:hypothetical protein
MGLGISTTPLTGLGISDLTERLLDAGLPADVTDVGQLANGDDE